MRSRRQRPSGLDGDGEPGRLLTATKDMATTYLPVKYSIGTVALELGLRDNLACSWTLHSSFNRRPLADTRLALSPEWVKEDKSVQDCLEAE
jgi:hypothetical protein